MNDLLDFRLNIGSTVFTRLTYLSLTSECIVLEDNIICNRKVHVRMDIT